MRKNISSYEPRGILDDDKHQVECLVRDELQYVVVVLDIGFADINLAGADVWIEVTVFIHH